MTGQLGDPTPHLQRPGSLAAAPPDTTFPVTLAALIGPTASDPRRAAVCIVGPETRALLANHFEVLDAVPSMAADLLSDRVPQRAVVEESALLDGVWLGSTTGDTTLLDQVCALLGTAEERGGTSVFIPASETTAASTLLAAAAGLSLPFADDDPALAEQGPLPPWLTELNRLVRGRS